MKQSFSRAAWIQWLALAVDWNGFVTCTQSQRSEPSSRSRIILVMWLPTFGLIVFAGSRQWCSAFSRWAASSTIMSAGRRCEKVPTSRAVPQADGWPVSEKAPAPGRACLPVSRCTMYACSFTQVPRVCWLKPIVQ